MDNTKLGGLFLVCALVVAGVLIYDSRNPNTTDDDLTGTFNQNTGNNTTNNDSNSYLTLNPLLIFISPSTVHFSQNSSSDTYTPTPGPSPDPMDRVISLFDQYIKNYYDQSLIPGMAVVIVQNDKVVYMNCLGVKDLASGEPVDENTLFGICSITKQFSATNVAQLVDKGLISWNDPITKYYPNPDEFKLYDDYVTENVTINDCLIHCIGLPVEGGNDYPTYFNDSYPSALYKLRYMENTTPLRSAVQYNSMIYALPGYCAAKVNNTTWNNLIKTGLLDPLGMTTATTSYYDFMNSANHVTPYKLLKNGTMKAYDVIPDPIGPAGSMACSISEMANWLRFQIADTGYYNGVEIVSQKELDETRTGKMYMNQKNTSMIGYGWGIKDNGTTIYHDGDSDAFFSQITIYTAKDVGIVILSNGGQYAYNFKICLDAKFRELLKGNEDFDPWPARKNLTDNTWKEDVPEQYVTNPQPLTAYVGEYSNNIFGLINVTLDSETLICHYGNNNQSFDLKHWSNTTFEDQTNNHFFNFTDFDGGSAAQVDVTFNFPPENGTFNRTT